MTVWHSICYEVNEKAFIEHYLEHYDEVSKDAIIDAIDYDLTNYDPVFIHKGIEDDEYLFDDYELKQLVMILKARLKEREEK